MKISLVICTYMRPDAIMDLLESVKPQRLQPHEIIIVDGSTNEETKRAVSGFSCEVPVHYHLVEPGHRGLTRQRNFGTARVAAESEIVAFLDDDVVLHPQYFEEIAKTFAAHPEAIGVGGLDVRENGYFKLQPGQEVSRFSHYVFDGYATPDSLRFKIRKLFGLMPDLPPDIIPAYSHGRSGHPPSGKTYEVEHLIGLSMAYRKSLFGHIRFSPYFEGYGLYEDFDFSLRSLAYGKLYVNTKATLEHYHVAPGRPNFYKYGQMVVTNGWYVWRLRFPKTRLADTLKWHLTCLLLTHIRLLIVVKGPHRGDAVRDYLGRMKAWFVLWFKKPRVVL
ncbi:glycosyltransferase family 2 protein [Algoriphagus sp. H41]|uniref:Glycosyltransferase family 2 protein n=1 Tax=Algoriphagus oliviformis TaxID=2811231 RepID=A0ABS3C717_9BACT|nr:glycosyltransferase family 2 protein [Algoriphagus oliviformis]MBN7812907.1 glycosyltransferase family 2 protein [Algoriphagus oliviformis]